MKSSWKIAEELIAGGAAEGKPDNDFSPKQLAAGTKIEREHTNSNAIAKEIAKDHLVEIPDYYPRLKKMEDAAPKSASVLARGILKRALDEDTRHAMLFTGGLYGTFGGGVGGVLTYPSDLKKRAITQASVPGGPLESRLTPELRKSIREYMESEYPATAGYLPEETVRLYRGTGGPFNPAVGVSSNVSRPNSIIRELRSYIKKTKAPVLYEALEKLPLDEDVYRQVYRSLRNKALSRSLGIGALSALGAGALGAGYGGLIHHYHTQKDAEVRPPTNADDSTGVWQKDPRYHEKDNASAKTTREQGGPFQDDFPKKTAAYLLRKYAENLGTNEEYLPHYDENNVDYRKLNSDMPGAKGNGLPNESKKKFEETREILLKGAEKQAAEEGDVPYGLSSIPLTIQGAGIGGLFGGGTGYYNLLKARKLQAFVDEGLKKFQHTPQELLELVRRVGPDETVRLIAPGELVQQALGKMIKKPTSAGRAIGVGAGLGALVGGVSSILPALESEAIIRRHLSQNS